MVPNTRNSLYFQVTLSLKRLVLILILTQKRVLIVFLKSSFSWDVGHTHTIIILYSKFVKLFGQIFNYLEVQFKLHHIWVLNFVEL